MINVKFPQFELIGPPCKNILCKGTLIQYASLITKDVYYKCNSCNQEFEREPGINKLNKSIDIIKRIFFII